MIWAAIALLATGFLIFAWFVKIQFKKELRKRVFSETMLENRVAAIELFMKEVPDMVGVNQSDLDFKEATKKKFRSKSH